MKIPTPYQRSGSPTAPFYFQLTIGGKRVQWCSGSCHKDEAISLCMKHLADLRLGIQLRKKEGAVALQEVIDLYQNGMPGIEQSTIRGNILKFRAVLSASKLDFGSPVAALTRQVVMAWQHEHRHNPITANSYMRQARSIFSRRAMVLYDGLSLPDISGFMIHPLLREPRRGYVPPPDSVVQAIVEDAKILQITQPAAYCAFLLELYGGLRAAEVIAAEWTWLRPHGDAWMLEIPWEVTKANASRFVGLSNEVVDELRRCSTGRWIVPVQSRHGRTVVVHRVLGPWLRKRLPQGRKTNHELRKLFGSAVARASGLFAAQKVLGHSSPRLTSDYYAGLLSVPDAVSPSSFRAAG